MGDKISKEFNKKISKLYDIRYPTMIILVKDRAQKEEILNNAKKINNIKIIDYLQNVLNQDDSPILGSFDRVDFLEWLVERSKKKQLLLVFNAETLFATWPDYEIKNFFNEFLKIENNFSGQNIPIVIITNNPIDFHILIEDKGQGILWNLQ